MTPSGKLIDVLRFPLGHMRNFPQLGKRLILWAKIPLLLKIVFLVIMVFLLVCCGGWSNNIIPKYPLALVACAYYKKPMLGDNQCCNRQPEQT